MLITPERTSVLECTEASQTFSDTPETGLPFYSDLYSLALDHCSSNVFLTHFFFFNLLPIFQSFFDPGNVTKQMEQATPIFIDSVYQFLLATLVLSYAWLPDCLLPFDLPDCQLVYVNTSDCLIAFYISISLVAWLPNIFLVFAWLPTPSPICRILWSKRTSGDVEMLCHMIIVVWNFCMSYLELHW